MGNKGIPGIIEVETVIVGFRVVTRKVHPVLLDLVVVWRDNNRTVVNSLIFLHHGIVFRFWGIVLGNLVRKNWNLLKIVVVVMRIGILNVGMVIVTTVISREMVVSRTVLNVITVNLKNLSANETAAVVQKNVKGILLDWTVGKVVENVGTTKNWTVREVLYGVVFVEPCFII